jgi:hypothetical protein
MSFTILSLFFDRLALCPEHESRLDEYAKASFSLTIAGLLAILKL